MLGLSSHITNENVSFKMTTAKNISIIALADDTRITQKYLYLLDVPRSVLTIHFSFSGRLNCPSAIEAEHVLSQMKKIHAHDK